MGRPICLKCGSTRIDDGRSYIVCGLGLCLTVAAFVAVLTLSPRAPVNDWANYVPDQNTRPEVAVVLILGIFMSVTGLTPVQRVRCRKCGTRWTPAGTKLRSRSPYDRA